MQEVKVTFSITIQPPPPPALQVILPDGVTVAQVSPAVNPLSDGQVGTAFSAQLGLRGGTPPDTLSLSSGALPDGLDLTADGQITGTPTAPGSFTFEIDVKDSAA